jgi:hypothetical protein
MANGFSRNVMSYSGYVGLKTYFFPRGVHMKHRGGKGRGQQRESFLLAGEYHTTQLLVSKYAIVDVSKIFRQGNKKLFPCYGTYIQRYLIM